MKIIVGTLGEISGPIGYVGDTDFYYNSTSTINHPICALFVCTKYETHLVGVSDTCVLSQATTLLLQFLQLFPNNQICLIIFCVCFHNLEMGYQVISKCYAHLARVSIKKKVI